MDDAVVLLICLFSIVTLIAVIYSIVCHMRVKRMFKVLDKMLDDSISGRFDIKRFDESKISALEIKFKKYIDLCSKQNIELIEEKTKVEELISDISHQTRTPLANIILYGQLLQEKIKCGNNKDILTDVVKIEKQTEKLNFQIQSLINISRIETGIINIVEKKNDVNELVRNTLEDLILKANKKMIKMKFDYNDNTFAMFDMKWTREAFFNVLDNAIKYTPSNGSITIDIVKYEMFTAINVTDSGIGISEEEYSQIFTRFYRSPSVSDYEGTGIGLYVTRKILELENGYIKVKSNLSKGSTFSLYLKN